MKTFKWIDIHTHRLKRDDEVLQVLNVFSHQAVPANTWFSVGTHPWFVQETVVLPPVSVLENPYCLAVGETGMDRTKRFTASFGLQKKVFERHIRLAADFQKPLIIHCVRCYDDLIKMTSDFPYPKIIHGFSRGPELAVQLINKGFYLSFGALLLKKGTKVREALKNIPAEKIFFETDDAGVSVQEVYNEAAVILEMPLELLREQIRKNFLSVFDMRGFTG